MVRIGPYVDRGPVITTAGCVLVQKVVARDVLRAGTIIPQYRSPGVTGMRGVNPLC